jgi:hypothetical protein
MPSFYLEPGLLARFSPTGHWGKQNVEGRKQKTGKEAIFKGE